MLFKYIFGFLLLNALKWKTAVLISVSANEEAPVNDDFLNKLFQKVISYQVLKEQNYTPPFKWAEKLGNPVAQEIRSGSVARVFDNDMFSSGWIITVLLEANLYGSGAPQLDENNLKLALEAIGSYHNRNDENAEKSLIRTFWPQVYNSTDKTWNQQPDNIRYVALNIEKIPFDGIAKLLRDLGLKKLADIVESLKEFGSVTDAFCIPPDFDDSYLNLGLGATLQKLSNIYPKSYSSWLNNNTDVAHLIDVTSKYAYRPFTSDINQNTIDPRTYFWSRKFIEQAQGENKSLSLITTWIQNIEEQRVLQQKKISMPFNLNNVDVTVAANSVYGITSGSIFNVNNFGNLFLNNTDLQSIYLNSTKFIGWAISNNFSSRPDLAQVYYPSTYNFLWYSSRTLFLIENEYQNYLQIIKNDKREANKEFVERFESLQSILFEAKSYLQDAFENGATQDLMKWSIPVDNKRTQVYFRDFLGLNDTSIFEKPEQNNEDSIFSTAQALNILIATWSYQNPVDKKLYLKKNTSNEVVSLIKGCAAWLRQNSLQGKFKPLNAFFSGSVKGFTSLPFWYPTNLVQYLNGTYINPDKIDPTQKDLEQVIAGVSGLIDEKNYENELKLKHFGQSTPLDFEGYNTKDNFFPFWSSEAYTYSCSLLALAQFNNLVI